MEYPHSKRSSKSVNLETGLITLFFVIIGYLIYIITIFNVTEHKDYSFLIFILSWLGILISIYIVFTWYKITNYLFSPYIIFMLFFILFNYGQALMWALGIHVPSEIGKAPLFPGFGVPNDADIVKGQMVTLISILMFHFGSLLSYKKKFTNFKYTTLQMPSVNLSDDSKTLKSIYYSCFLIGIVVIPATLIHSFQDFQISMVHGYKSLYYSDFARTDATILGLLRRMFFPCLVGLLIGSRFNRKVRYSVYSIFSIYLLFNLLAGDRGSWIYGLFLLIWLSHACYKPINFKILLKYSIMIFLGLYVTYALVSMRSIGLSNITFYEMLEALSFENSVLIRPFFEMGGSMGVTITLQKYGWDIWPYANTYLLAVLGMVTNNVIYVLDIPFSLISSWFSQSYLGISYGAGFSIIAEALLNFGPLLAPIFMILLGYLISSLIYIDKNIDYKNSSLRFLFVVSTLHAIIPVTRGYFHLLLKDWFYGIVPLFVLIIFIRKLIFKNNTRLNNKK